MYTRDEPVSITLSDKIGDAYLDPGWTSYNQTVLYSTYDITAAMQEAEGSVVLGVQLGNGWWNLVPLLFWGSKDFRDNLATGDLMFLALVNIWFDDGSSQQFSSSSLSWKVASSPVCLCVISLPSWSFQVLC
jgi:alpha-L-rhamnosidase